MERSEHRVAIVVDRTYAERIAELADQCHMWVVRSLLNDAVVAARRQTDPSYSLEKGITTFNGAETPEASFLSILGTVELHHGEHSHDPPLSILEVIGLELTDAIRKELDSYEFHHVQPSGTGFVARRNPA